jgi:hypothetical protein
VPQKRLPDVCAQDGACTKGQDTLMLGQPFGDRLSLKRPEVGFTTLDEEIGDRLARGRLDVVVGVAKTHLPSTSKSSSNGRLPRAWGAYQNRPRAFLCHVEVT